MTRENKQRIALAVSVVAFVLIGLVLMKPDMPDLPPYLSTSADRDGVKGLYTLLKERDAPVKEWKRAWNGLPATKRHTLVSIQPYGIGSEEIEEIERWVGRGNHLLLFDSAPEQWERFPLTELDRSLHSVVPIMDANRPSGHRLSGEVASVYRLEEADGIEPLLLDERGMIAGRIPIGEGSVTLFLVPEWTRNDSILKYSHFELIWPYLLADSDAIWFDEYYHGIREQPGLLAVYPNWLLAVLLQLVIGVLLWLWLKAVRFGPAYTPRAWTVRRGDETLLAAAGWYERRKLAREALRHQANYVRSLLARRFGVRADANDSQVMAAARLHMSKEDADRLEQVLQSWQDAEKAPSYTVKQFVKDSRRADYMIQKLERE
ncbi:hypothetical protein PAE9249_01769 [Paenibacillus sp. CECT 9249]|uniref:DUF4350 domain-containing protein n=1 Tax=Paenibacillus sp. CECT 9249 TaxID=2845385 RepID=UPI001E459716|nr:DUF4350 domain-containing protein [Paenibacillus sp. CECT 9249]CAH0119270.1 hypothetical protein PAE9249_01769 [Paenibacillus sp. CECT 9249]